MTRVSLPSPRGALRSLLTGYPDGAAPWVRDLANSGDDGWFGPGSTVWAVHVDAAMLVGGIRALLIQAMHPVVLAGFDEHSDYREDPESRLQRTAAFVAITTFGTSRQAEDACTRVRRAHAPVRGATRDGLPYDAADPELLGWVHLALIDSLADSVRRFGRTAFDLDDYLAETAVIGERLSAAHVPHSCAELSAVKKHYLPFLALTAETRRAHVPARPAPPGQYPTPLPGRRVGRGGVAATGAAPVARCPTGPARPGGTAGRPGTDRAAVRCARPEPRRHSGGAAHREADFSRPTVMTNSAASSLVNATCAYRVSAPIHANSAREAVTKLCTLPVLAGENVIHEIMDPSTHPVRTYVLIDR